MNPEVIALLQHSVRAGDRSTFKRYTRLIDDQAKNLCTLRGLFKFTETKAIPIEVVIRNVVAGSLIKRTGLKEGHKLRQPIIECYYKSDELGDPMINDEHIRELALARGDEMEKIKRSALKINRTLTNFFAKANLTLVDFKLEFGRLYPNKHNIVLADEISPDTCRLWDSQTGKKLDKDRFRQDLGDLVEGYNEVLTRVEHALAS